MKIDKLVTKFFDKSFKWWVEIGKDCKLPYSLYWTLFKAKHISHSFIYSLMLWQNVGQ